MKQDRSAPERRHRAAAGAADYTAAESTLPGHTVLGRKAGQRHDAPPTLPAGVAGFVLHTTRRFWPWLALMLVLEVGQALSSILTPYAVKALMDGVARRNDLPLLDALSEPLWWLAGLGLAEILFSRASGAVLVIVGPRIRQNTARGLFAYLQGHPARYFSRHFAGALAHRISEAATGVNHTLWALLCEFWPMAITFGVSVWLLFGAHPDLGRWVAGWVGVYVLVSYLLALRCRPLARDYAAQRSQVNGQMVDSVSNMLNVQLFVREDLERVLLDGALEQEVRQGRKTFWYMERVRWFQFTLAAVLKVGTVAHALILWQAGQIGAGDFVMVAGLALLIINDARNLTRRFLEFFEYVGNIANGLDTIVTPYEMHDAPDARPLDVSVGRVEVRDLRFGYEPDRPVFDGLSVAIAPGERVGLVGFSGSGKSTFVNLLLRNIEPESGRILIDGQDIARVTRASLRRQVGLIPQDPSLFHRSLRENIAYGEPDADDDTIRAAALAADADAFIRRLPEGYAAMVGERGVKLSGGQRQRIALARVLLKNAPILILDEATSSLDSVTEDAIQRTLDVAMRGKTVLVIAHRLATVARLDRILVFDEGRLVEDGSHEQLLSQGGCYHRLWGMQVGGFFPEERPAA